jgi:hypothetical protein
VAAVAEGHDRDARVPAAAGLGQLQARPGDDAGEPRPVAQPQADRVGAARSMATSRYGSSANVSASSPISSSLTASTSSRIEAGTARDRQALAS